MTEATYSQDVSHTKWHDQDDSSDVVFGWNRLLPSSDEEEEDKDD